jgi:hypothetical protein
LTSNHAGARITVIHGPVADQAALHGLLSRVRDLGLPLISVTRVGPAGSGVLFLITCITSIPA